MKGTRQIESPDSLELLRIRCPECSHQTAVAVWCHDPACCSQSLCGSLRDLFCREHWYRLPQGHRDAVRAALEWVRAHAAA